MPTLPGFATATFQLGPNGIAKDIASMVRAPPQRHFRYYALHDEQHPGGQTNL